MRILLALLFVVPFVTAGCARQSAAPPPKSGPSVAVIPVVLRDFTIEPRALKLKAGTVRFQVTNRGAVDRNFQIPDLEKGPGQDAHLLRPGETKVLEYELKPGKHDIVCTIPGHGEAGMAASLEVIP